MATRKYIYWRPDMEVKDGQRFANVHVLGGYGDSLAQFKRIAEELRDTFPQATDDNIVCGVIRESSYVKNFIIVAFNAYIPDGEYPDFFQYDNDWTPEEIRDLNESLKLAQYAKVSDKKVRKQRLPEYYF